MGLAVGDWTLLGAAAAGAAAAGAALALVRAGRAAAAWRVLVAATTLLAAGTYALAPAASLALAAIPAASVLGAALGRRRSPAVLPAAQIVVVALACAARGLGGLSAPGAVAVDGALASLGIVLAAVAATLVAGAPPPVAAPAPGAGEALAKRISEVGARLGDSGSQILSTMQAQELGVSEQMNAVEAIERAMQMLLDLSREISSRCAVVASNAERDREDLARLNQMIYSLSKHSSGIKNLIDLVKGLANKAEILALNAALEGVRAGEAGEGFGIVAARMQGLAEQVLQSSHVIEQLAARIRSDTATAVEATESSAALAGKTARLAQEISVITRQQEDGTVQVTAAVSDILKISRQNVGAARQVIASVAELARVAETLDQLRRDSAGRLVPMDTGAERLL